MKKLNKKYLAVVPASNNHKMLASFTQYCAEHPHERFWQALRNWSGYAFIYVKGLDDTAENGYGQLKDTWDL